MVSLSNHILRQVRLCRDLPNLSMMLEFAKKPTTKGKGKGLIHTCTTSLRYGSPSSALSLSRSVAQLGQ